MHLPNPERITEEEDYPEPVLRAQDSKFVVNGTHFDIDILESSKIRAVIGTCAFVRGENKLTYAFLWKSGMGFKYHKIFGWETNTTILRIGKEVALQNGFTQSELNTLT